MNKLINITTIFFYFLKKWLELEQAKHGSIHLRMTWLSLSSDRNELLAALEETQLLRVNSMSTALLTVFIDSAKNLPVIMI